MTESPGLLGGKCPQCGTLQFPRRSTCPSCQSTDVAETKLSEIGTIFTFTIVHVRPPGYEGELPYAFGLVDLPEGLRVTSTLTAGDLESLAIGEEVRFELITLGTDGDCVLSYAYRQTKGSS
jgi:uncharacterized OB-fold protein